MNVQARVVCVDQDPKNGISRSYRGYFISNIEYQTIPQRNELKLGVLIDHHIYTPNTIMDRNMLDTLEVV